MSVKQGGKTIAGATQYHPDLFDFKWADHILNDAQWLMANTFSWQYGSMYQTAYAHLAADIVGKTLQSETVAGVAVQFYLADDGHKICPDSEEDKVLSIYNKIGNAWYYIIDTINQRFKLPRRHSQQIVRSVKNADGSWYRLYADGWVEQGGQFTLAYSGATVTLPIELDNTGYVPTIQQRKTSVPAGFITSVGYMPNTTTITIFGNWSSGDPDNPCSWQVSGQSAIDMSSFQDGEKYLYFYVGAFTQTSLENIASIATETLNNKVDKGHQLVEFREPTAANNYTWYRKYDDGWVEQGGSGVSANVTITLPKPMADDHYTATMPGITTYSSIAGIGADAIVITKTTTTIKYGIMSAFGFKFDWQVSGMAA